jgi:hypothetical protein
MAKKTYQDTDGTSFHGVTIRATVDQLTKAFGEPYDNNSGDDKVNFEWDMETDEGNVFTIYDWKVGRPLSIDEPVEWHIGAHSRSIASDASYEILRELGNLVD